MRFIRSCRGMLSMLALALIGCSGGEALPVDASLSTESLVFSAASPEAPTPAEQSLTAQVSAGTVHVAVLYAGAAIERVAHTFTGETAQIVVTPRAPGTVGAGVFTGAVTVTPYGCANADCSRLAPGAAQVLRVTLEIPPIVNFVAPYAGTAGASSTAIIRGRGFQRFAIDAVRFGATPASNVFVVSDTELHATYPALLAGSYDIQIDAPTSPGPIQSTASLVVVDAPTFAAGALAHPGGDKSVRGVIYDAERATLLLAVDDPDTGGEIIRIPSANGLWGSPATAAVSGLSDIALSTNGAQLLVLSQTGLTPTDPVTLAAGATTNVTPGEGVFLKNIAVGNNGEAVVTTGYNGSNATPLYIFDTRTAQFFQPATTPSLDNATPGAAANGSLVSLVQGHATVTTEPNVYRYYASTGEFSVSEVLLIQNRIAPVLDRAATRLILNGARVYDAAHALLGTLPDTTAAVAISPDGARAYTLDSTAPQLLTFDLGTVQEGGTFAQIGAGTALAGDPGSDVKMAISPDGRTLFIVGSSAAVVQPAP